MPSTLEEIEAAIASPAFSHARGGDGCWRDVCWIYHVDPDSPSGVKLAVGGDAAVVLEVLKRLRGVTVYPARPRDGPT